MELESIIGSYAFPIVMCLWFMFRTEKIIQANTIATENLSNNIFKYFNKNRG